MTKPASRRDILFISSNFPPVLGGSMVVYDQLCRNLADRVVALAPARDFHTGQPWAIEDDHRGYSLHRIAYVRPPITGTTSGLAAKIAGWLRTDVPVMLALLVAIVRLWWGTRFTTVVLGELMSIGWLVLPLRFLLRRRVVLYIHGEEVAQTSQSLLSRLSPIFLRQADAIIAGSHFCAGQIVANFAIDPAKISILPYGVDLARFSRGVADRSMLPAAWRDKRLLLSVSRLVARKGHASLIPALPSIIAKHPDAHCVIVGDGPEAENLRRQVREAGLDDQCSFLGAIGLSELINLYRCSALFVLPCQTQPDGDTEGFGLVFLEANACGLPVVGGIAGGTIEAIIDGETGLVVEGADPNAIARAVTLILDDATLAQHLAERGWARAQRMGWRSVSQDFLKICLPALAPRAKIAATPIAAAVPDRQIPHLLVTVDVEEQFAWDRFAPQDYRVDGVAALRRFHRAHQSIGVTPTYLLTYPVLNDPDHQAFFRAVRDEGSGDLGIHLHSWTTPPFWEQANIFTSYQCNLPEHVERRKLQILCRRFEELFGEPATIHRAGRWGGNQRTAALLEEVGITLDLSASAGLRADGLGGPDFSHLDGRPFWSGPRGTVLAIPATALRYGRGPHALSTACFAARRAIPALRIFPGNWGKPVRLSPEQENLALLTAMIREIGRRGLPVALYSLHSTSLFDDGNPYSRGAGRSDQLLRRSITLLSRAIAEGWVQPSSCARFRESLTPIPD